MKANPLLALGVVVTQAACSAEPGLHTLLIDLQGAVCVDKLADGRCDAEFARPGIDATLQTDYLQSVPYAAVMVVALDRSELIEQASPGAELKQARDLGTATQLSYTIHLDDPALARALEARGRDNLLAARFDPVLLERWVDASGQPVDRVEQLDLVIAH